MAIFTVEAIFNIVACVPLLISIFVLARKYAESHNRQLIFMILGWVAMFGYLLTESISYIINSIEMYRYHSLFLLVLGLSVIIWVDFINRDEIEPWKLAFFSFLVGIIGVFIFRIDAIYSYNYPNGDPSFGIRGEFIYWIVALNLFPGILWVYFSGKVHRNAPDHLKSFSLVFFLGGIVITLGPLLVVALRLTLILPGIDAIFIGIGALMISIVFVKAPQLGYILPFRVSKLAVVDQSSNLVLFMHKWNVNATKIGNKSEKRSSRINEDKVEDSVFSGMLYGINRFVKKTVMKGDIQEIKTEEAVLMIKSPVKHPVNFVLLTTNSTKSLEHAFNSFVERFIDEYSRFFYRKFEKGRFSSARKLIDEAFPFIPYNIKEPEPSPVKQQFYAFLSKFRGKQKDISSKKVQGRKPKDIFQTPKMCVACRNVKDLEGNWEKIEEFVKAASGGEISWEMCPDCQDQKRTILLSYFDDTIGPQIFIVEPMGNYSSELREIPKLLELDKGGFFLSTIEERVVANYQFSIKAEGARGNRVDLLLSYLNLNGQLREGFARDFLKDLANAIMSLKDVEKAILIHSPRVRIKSEIFKELMALLERYRKLIPEKIIEYRIGI